jgi:hypothetical protein
MNSVPASEAIVPLPEFSPSLAGDPRANGVGLRRFGIFESDLAIDFAGGDPHMLITRLLGECTVDPEGRFSAAFFRTLSVGKRLECLLVLAAGEDGRAFNFPFPCVGCSQEIELELTLEEIAGQQREADLIETVEIEIKGKPVVFRKARGSDQEAWAAMHFRDEKEAAAAMIGTLAVSQDIPKSLGPDELDLIDEAMDEADPLVNFLCRVTCGECNSPNEFLVDLCDVALGMLNRLQQQLLVMIHKLASHYHWNEKEIFEIPHWRRQKYLELIAAGR